ncbi:MAG: hypothetical protein IKE22_12825, partial [Atopobiaceae bacterium]|nr:hypothetical protein [Atopobiaceae bacterium]
DVVEGGGLDAQARRGVTSDFVVRLRLIAFAVVTILLLGAIRVALTTATVTHLKANLETKAGIERAIEVNAALRIERSVLSNTTRITRIATQNYGMVYAVSHDYLDVPTAERIAAERYATTMKQAEVAIESADIQTAASTSSYEIVLPQETLATDESAKNVDGATIPSARQVTAEIPAAQ